MYYFVKLFVQNIVCCSHFYLYHRKMLFISLSVRVCIKKKLETFSLVYSDCIEADRSEDFTSELLNIGII